MIKASDFTDGVGLIYTTGSKAVKSACKYTPLVPVLADLIARPDTPLTCQAKTRSEPASSAASRSANSAASPKSSYPTSSRLSMTTLRESRSIRRPSGFSWHRCRSAIRLPAS